MRQTKTQWGGFPRIVSSVGLICVFVPPLASMADNGKNQRTLTETDLRNIGSIVQQEIQREHLNASPAQQIPQPLKVRVDNAKSGPPDWLTPGVALVSSILALIGVAWVSYRTFETTKITIALQNKQKFTELVWDGLKFFGAKQGTQSRSVGISIIKANVNDRVLELYRPTWRSVLESQAVYLLTRSDQEDRLDEIANLGSIADLLKILLKDTPDGSFDTSSLKAAVEKNQKNWSPPNGKGPGLDLRGDEGKNVLKKLRELCPSVPSGASGGSNHADSNPKNP